MRRSTKIQLALLNNLVWVMVAVFFLFNSVFTPSFLSSRNLLNILFQSATLGLMVLGQGIVMMVYVNRQEHNGIPLNYDSGSFNGAAR